MPDPLWINASAGAPAYSANELRQAMGLALMYDGRNMGVRKGVRPGGNQLFVSLVSTTITVQPGLCALDPALTTPQGSYWVAIPTAETHTLTAADPTNPRKDIVIARVYDHDEDASGLRLTRSEYLVGTPAPSPAEPALPASAIKLALIDVPASPGAPVVTDRRPWTVATGGILPVTAAADITAAVEGRYRDRLDTNVLERDSGAAWETVADPQMFKAWSTWVPTLTNLTLGNGTQIARYKQVGQGSIDWYWKLILGTTSTVGTDPTFTLPAAYASSYGAASGENFFPGTARIVDSGVTTRPADLTVAGGSGLRLVWWNSVPALAQIMSNSPWIWGTGDFFMAWGRYEPA